LETTDTPYLLCGLGNPGSSYKKTRHNVGFRAIDELAGRSGTEVKTRTKNYWWDEVKIAGSKAVLIKPRTYMNNSGIALQSAMTKWRVPVERLIVIVDDYALPLGLIRIRSKGSAGSHNGLKSIVDCIGRSDFARIRIGIDDKPQDIVTSDYVLGKFSSEEEELIRPAIKNAADAAELIISEDIMAAMNDFNKRVTQSEDTDQEETGI
jgi:peptidyl-tRNA hydrolase, PTH1 family